MPRHGLQAEHTTWPDVHNGHEHIAGMHARQRRERATDLAQCRGMTFYAAKGCSGRLGGLGHDKGFLYHDRVLWPYVATVVLCHDRTWARPRAPVSRQRTFYRNRDGS